MESCSPVTYKNFGIQFTSDSFNGIAIFPQFYIKAVKLIILYLPVRIVDDKVQKMSRRT